MKPVPKDLLVKLLEDEVWPYMAEPERIDLKSSGLCSSGLYLIQGDEFFHLQAKHFRITDDKQNQRRSQGEQWGRRPPPQNYGRLPLSQRE